MNEQEIKNLANDITLNIVTGLTFDQNFDNLTCGQVRLLSDKIFNGIGAGLFRVFPKAPAAPAAEAPNNGAPVLRPCGCDCEKVKDEAPAEETVNEAQENNE